MSYETEVISKSELRTHNEYGETITARLIGGTDIVEFYHTDMPTFTLTIADVHGVFFVAGIQGRSSRVADRIIVNRDELRWMLNAEAELQAIARRLE